MEIEVFTSCTRYEDHPEYGPTIYGIGPAIQLPHEPDAPAVTIFLGYRFDETDRQARTVSLRFYDDDEELIGSFPDRTLSPSDNVARSERQSYGWKLRGELFYKPGYYVAALVVDGEEVRRLTLGAILRPEPKG